MVWNFKREIPTTENRLKVIAKRFSCKFLYCNLGQKEQDLLKIAITELNFSARAYDKILKISRTIADLEGNENINSDNVSEAIEYRSLDKNMWV